MNFNKFPSYNRPFCILWTKAPTQGSDEQNTVIYMKLYNQALISCLWVCSLEQNAGKVNKTKLWHLLGSRRNDCLSGYDFGTVRIEKYIIITGEIWSNFFVLRSIIMAHRVLRNAQLRFYTVHLKGNKCCLYLIYLT